MAVEIIHDAVKQVACMYDNTTDTAFGPVFSGPSADVEVQEFMDWLRDNAEKMHWAVAVPRDGDGTDPRHWDAGELERVVKFWCELPSVEYVGEEGLQEPDGTRYLGGGNIGSTSR